MVERRRTLRRGLRAFLHLGWTDRLDVLRIVAVASVVEIGLRAMNLRALARLLRVSVDFHSTEVGAPPDEPLPVVVLHRIRLVRTALAYSPTGPTCLRTSLVCARLLRSFQPTIRIGVARVEGEVKAHALVELAGRSIDPGAAEFAPIHFG